MVMNAHMVVMSANVVMNSDVVVMNANGDGDNCGEDF